MKWTGLNGQKYSFQLSSKSDEREARSAGHLLCRAILPEIFPFDRAYEEIFIPGCTCPLYLDFLIPTRKIAVEVQGAQHRKFISWFHGTQNGFKLQRKRDAEKRAACQLNGITIIELDDDKTEDWGRILLGVG